ncbi:hypothetical protein [Funiculus sociatus]|uniref:hypothetical protein n=1 Tax=Funiculus sociatus TaxID=450527 RepID=UPI00329BCE3C
MTESAGSGKSAIYQIAGLLIPGSTVVISPLIALQRDQIESIARQDVGEAAVVNSTRPPAWLMSHAGGLLDTLLLQAGAGFKLQETSEPKSEDAPDNLFEPIAGFDQVEGDFSKQSRANSYSTWLETHLMAKWGGIAFGIASLTAMTTALGALGLEVLVARVSNTSKLI